MPPRAAPASSRPAKLSESRAVVPIGPREVVRSRRNQLATKRDEWGNKPSTIKAITIRNGKHGTMGTGELVSTKIRMSGREKLELLAEDLESRYSQAVIVPYTSSKAIAIADSQFTNYLDDIQNLQDADLFKDIVEAEVLALKPHYVSGGGKKAKQPPNPLQNPDFIAKTLSLRIHNSYMLASAWRILGQMLTDIQDITDGEVRAHLKNDAEFRNKYFVLYHLATTIVEITQSRFSVLAKSAPHWNQFFKENPNKVPGQDQEYVFDWEHLKRVHKSYIDSIVVEIGLPGSPIPKGVLLHILRDAVDETPKDAKLFPQLLWDALGDLSIAVQLLDLLESPILDEEGQAWKKDRPKMPDDYEAWVDAQLFSENACKEYATFKDQLSPWAMTIGQQTVDTIWKYINLNYQGVCGKSIDELWLLSDIKKRAPAWFAKPPPKEGEGKKADYDSDDNAKSKTVAKSSGAKGGATKSNKKLPALKDGNDSDGSMPSLQTVSDSSEDDFNFESDSEDDESEEEDSDDESEFDEEMEDHVRELIRDAMDIAMVDPDFTNPRSQAQLFEDMANDKKDNNPFIKLLGSLRGRLFSGTGAMKAANRAEPRSPYSGPKPPASAYKPAPPPPPPKAKAKPKPPPSKTTKATQPKSQAATVEDGSDDEEPTAAKKKKKKKPKKKKKSAAGSAEAQDVEAEPEAEAEPEPEPQPAPVPAASPPTSPQKNKKNKAPSVKSTASSATVAPSTASTITLPLPSEQTAQSARSYLRDVGLDSEKTKLKTRADHGNLTTIAERKGFFSRFTREKAEKSQVDEDAKHGMFEQLTKKAKTYMHQILNTPEDEKRGLAPMKWEHFCRVMTEMGFVVNESTAGSSVRFEPQNGRDHPISFHKPHPDPTIQPVMLKQFGKRLKRQYGWSEDDFYKRMS